MGARGASGAPVRMFYREIVIHHGEWQRLPNGEYQNAPGPGGIVWERHRLRRGNTDFRGISLAPDERERILIRDRLDELSDFFFGTGDRYADDDFLYEDISANLLRLIIQHDRRLPEHFDLEVAFDVLLDDHNELFKTLEDVWRAVASRVRNGMTVRCFMGQAETYGFEAEEFLFVHGLAAATRYDRRDVERMLREEGKDPVSFFGNETIDRESAHVRDSLGEVWFIDFPPPRGGAGAAAA